MKLEKNISLGKNNFILILLVLSLFLSIAKSEVNTKSQNEFHNSFWLSDCKCQEIYHGQCGRKQGGVGQDSIRRG